MSKPLVTTRVVKPAMYTSTIFVYTPSLGLPTTINAARAMRNELAGRAERGEAQPSGPHLKVGLVTQNRFSFEFHGWCVSYDRDLDRKTEKYDSRYYYKTAFASYSDSSLTFCGKTFSRVLWREVVYSWTRLATSAMNIKDDHGYIHLPCSTVFFTNGILEYLWKEGYQFEEYLPGRYEPNLYDKDRGSAIVRYLESCPSLEEAFMTQLRLWHLAELAQNNFLDLFEAGKVLTQEAQKSHKNPATFAQFLGTFCRNVMDNLLLLAPKVEKVAMEWSANDELEKVALEWTPLLTGVE